MNVRQTPTHPPRARSVRRAQQERFLAHVREGYAVSVAATTAGVAKDTVYGWRERGATFRERWACVG